MIKDEVGSVDGFGGEAQKQRLIGVSIQHGRGVNFEAEKVEDGVSGFSKAKLLVTGTEGTIGGMIEVEGKEAKDRDEERVI